MTETLYRYCVTHFGELRKSNKDVIDSCSRIFFVDGQKIDWELVNDELVEKFGKEEQDNTLAEDSIHFQQLRSYILSKQILSSYKPLVAGKNTLRVAVIGGGISGFTAALTLLKLKDKTQQIDVDIFEHHKKYLSKFAGAFGRRVYPYHHLRRADATVEESLQWSNGGFEELGGISGILSWKPGPVESVIREIEESISKEIKENKTQGKSLNFVCNTKVFGITENGGIGSPYTYGLVSVNYNYINRDVILNDDGVNELKIIGEDSEIKKSNYDIVIVAAGASKDSVTLLGQKNDEYWQPKRVENLPPRLAVDQIAIFGSGNSAASEIFNYVIEDDCFVKLLRQIQIMSKSNTDLKDALSIEIKKNDSLHEIKKKFKALNIDEKFLSSQPDIRSLLTDINKLKLTLFVRNTKDDVLRRMNPLNKFLVLFLYAIDHIEIRNLYIELNKTSSKDERISDQVKLEIASEENDSTGLYRLEFKKKLVKPTGIENEFAWTSILNCSGAIREYYQTFSSNRSDKEKSSTTYRVIHNGNEQVGVPTSVSKLIAYKVDNDRRKYKKADVFPETPQPPKLGEI